MTFLARASRVVKQLLPHAPGTMRQTERFGQALAGVRYLADSLAQQPARPWN